MYVSNCISHYSIFYIDLVTSFDPIDLQDSINIVHNRIHNILNYLSFACFAKKYIKSNGVSLFYDTKKEAFLY